MPGSSRIRSSNLFWSNGSHASTVCLVNGIPLVAFEAKQRAQQNSDWMKGVRDLSLYETKVPRLWASNLFAVACNGRAARYGVPGASSQQFAEWRDLSVHATPGNPLATPTPDFCTVAPIYVRAQWKRWGSCSAHKNISLNWRLIEAPKHVIDYVILHEMLHTRLMTHDHRFWAHLRSICPQASLAREWLERNRPE